MEKAPQYIKLLIQLRKKSNLPVYLSKLRSSADAPKAGSRFKHFIKHGFLITERNVIEDFLKLKGASDATDGFVFSIDRTAEPFTDIPSTVKMTQNLGLHAQFQVALANENPAIAENNDLANANRVAVASAVAPGVPGYACYLRHLCRYGQGLFPAQRFDRQAL